MNLKIDMKHYSNLDHVAIIGSHSVRVWTKNAGQFRIHAAEYVPQANADRFNAVYDELTRVHLTEADEEPLRVWAATDLAYAGGDTIAGCPAQAVVGDNQKQTIRMLITKLLLLVALVVSIMSSTSVLFAQEPVLTRKAQAGDQFPW